MKKIIVMFIALVSVLSVNAQVKGTKGLNVNFNSLNFEVGIDEAEHNTTCLKIMVRLRTLLGIVLVLDLISLMDCL